MSTLCNNEYFVILNEAKHNEESFDNQIDSSFVGMTNPLRKSNYVTKRTFLLKIDFSGFEVRFSSN